MRVAVLSDIHGFDLAFDVVLEDIDAQGSFDAIVVAGDLCETGPAPREVLETLWNRPGIIAIHGNTDLYLVDIAANGTTRKEKQFTVEAIGEDGVAYLASLPFSHRIPPPGSRGPHDDLLIVHANPRNVMDALYPDLTDGEIRLLLDGEAAGALAFGHIHISYVRQIDDTLLVDVAAVGNSKDGDISCRYGILTWDEAGRRWSAEIRKLSYPLEETEAQIRASGLPKPEKTIQKLREAAYLD
ncbi:MAG: metallophosphoesterase family protein [Thermomicrobiales bacterium]|nr:metallophosphoesterase family protein [Thermomicrobiales bacterium]